MVVEREARINLTTNVGSTIRAINELAKIMQGIARTGKGAMGEVEDGAEHAADAVGDVGVAAGKSSTGLSRMGAAGKASGRQIAAGAKESSAAMTLLSRELDQVKGLIGGMGAIAGAKWAVSQAADANRLTKQMQVLTSHEGFGAVREDFAKINELTGGMVNNFEAVGAVNRAMAFGIDLSNGKLAKLIELSAKTSKVMGTEMVDTLNDLFTGVSRLSVPIIDNLGVTFKLEDAYRDYAGSIGKVNSALTTQEKQTAVLNVVLEKLEENTKNVSSRGSALDEMFAMVRDVVKDAGDGVNYAAESLRGFSDDLNRGFDSMIDASDEYIKGSKAKMLVTAESIELTKEEIQVMYDLQGTGLSEGQMDAIAAERVKYRKDQEKLLNFELERKKKLTVEQAEAEGFESDMTTQMGTRGMSRSDQGASMQGEKITTSTSGIGISDQATWDARAKRAKDRIIKQQKDEEVARKKATEAARKAREKAAKDQADADKALAKDFEKWQKEEIRNGEKLEKERAQNELDAAKADLDLKKDLLEQQQRYEKKMLKDQLKYEKQVQEDRVKIYQFAGDQIVAAGEATLDAIILGEAERLPYVIANQAYTSGKQIFFNGLRTFLFGLDQNAILPGLGATAATQGAASMGIGSSLVAAGAIGMVAFPDPAKEAKSAASSDKAQDRKTDDSGARASERKKADAMKREAGVIGPISLFPDQTSMYNFFASQGFVINQ